MLTKARQTLQMCFAVTSRALFLIIPVCVFPPCSQKCALPGLLQVAEKHHRHLPRLLLSAEPNHAVLHRDVH